MASDTIYLDNDALIFLDVLTDKDGNYINDATVEATLYGSTDSEVGGATWPLTLDYVAGSDGRYEKVLDKAVGVVLNEWYRLKIVVTASGTNDGVFWKDVEARRRVS